MFCWTDMAEVELRRFANSDSKIDETDYSTWVAKQEKPLRRNVLQDCSALA